MRISAFVLCFVVVVNGRTLREKRETSRECGHSYMLNFNASSPMKSVRRPWLVGIYQTLHFNMLICEGALIDKRFVLTAAQCVNRVRLSKLSVKFGDISLESHVKLERNVKNKIVHGAFVEIRPWEVKNDIALLELETPVEYETHIMPVCLPETAFDTFDFVANVSGWGSLEFSNPLKTPTMREVSFWVDSRDSCDSWYKSRNSDRRLPETALCGRLRLRGRQGPCRNGASLTLERNGQAYLLGVSTGLGTGDCAPTESPIAFTNVANYVTWIKTNMAPKVEREENDFLRFIAFLIFASLFSFFVGLVAFLKRTRPECLDE